MESPRHRKSRRIWSCTECRRKKLQCDHGLPACGRCTQAGRAAKCTYAHNVNSKDDSTPDLAQQEVFTSKLDVLETRLQNLEGKATKPGTATRASAQPYAGWLDSSFPQYLQVKPADQPCNQQGILYGGAFKTKYGGNTDARSMVENIPGFAEFTAEAYTIAGAPHLFNQIQTYLNPKETRPNLLSPVRSPISATELKSLLPPKAELDTLIKLYCETFDCVYPVLHVPTFMTASSQVWNLAEDCDMSTLVLVAVVAAISYCLNTSTVSPRHEGQQFGRDKALALLEGCERWLCAHMFRYDEIVEFQISFLYLLARQLNARRRKRTWINAGAIVRAFMSAGLHRNPALLVADTTPLDQVMRQRIWAAAAEFELQAAFEHGMPASSWHLQSDIGPPAVTADCYSPIGYEEVVAEQKFTKTSFLSTAGKTLPLRHELNSILNDTRRRISFDEAIAYTSTLNDWHSSLATVADPASIPVSAILTIMVHQYILALHAQQLKVSSSFTERQISRRVLQDSAMEMIKHHKIARDHGSNVVELLYHDHLRVALSICYANCHADVQPGRAISGIHIESAHSALADLLNLFTEKVLSLGGAALSLWLISAGGAILLTQSSPEMRRAHLQKAIDDYARPFYQLMAQQPTNANGDADAAANILAEGGCQATSYHMGAGVANGMPSTRMLAGAEEIDTDFMFDDWIFEWN